MTNWALDLSVNAYLSCLIVVLLCLMMIVSNILLPLLLRIAMVMSDNKRNLTAKVPIRTISVIVPAYNEEKSIGKKIDGIWQALQNIDVETEVIIGSDGSSDKTLEIASARIEEMSASNWRILAFDNEGKCNTINKLVREARGELIISTDADVTVPEKAIDLVLRAFQSNSKLGCLSCVPLFNSHDGGSQRHYWSFEDNIRQAESSLGKLIVVTGWLYAFRRNVYEEIPSGVMADDLWIPLTVLLKGYDCQQAEQLLVPSERTDEETEIRRRKRVISGGMDVVRRLFPRLMRNPKLLFLVLAHKVNRWALPFWLLLFFVSTVAIWPWLLCGYALVAVLGFCFLGKRRFLTLAYAGITPFLSFGEVVRKKDFARWEHTRNPGES